MSALLHPLDERLALVGAPGSGKTVALVQRAARACSEGMRVLLCAPSERATARLRALLETTSAAGSAVCVATLDEAAFGVLEGLEPDRERTRIDDVRAAHIFEGAGARLFTAEWVDFVGADTDPEITGLRAPQRFAATAYRLIRKLRRAHIGPDEFERFCRRGTTEFFGRPPNFASAEAITATRQQYRDSLRVDAAELQRQHAREVDLVTILVRLYRAYVDALVARGALTGADAVFEATALLAARRKSTPYAPYDAGFVDDAQDCNEGEFAFLRALFGDDLRGVTLAGDPQQSSRGFAGARGSAVLEAGPALALGPSLRCPPEILATAARVLEPRSPVPPREGAVILHRASDIAAEARFVASEVAGLLRDGVAPERIAVIVRDLAGSLAYVDALLARDVPVNVAGEANLYEFPAVLDGLAPLWAFADPYRHEYVLRVLEGPWMALSDASIATLCAESSQAQPLLFALPEEVDDEAQPSRWDPMRDLRLGRNVTRGDVDGELPPESRVRLEAFRAALARWERAERTLPLPALARYVLEESALAAAGPGARSRFGRGMIMRLLDEIETFAERDPAGTLADFLDDAEARAAAGGDLQLVADMLPQSVLVLDVEAAKGAEFDHVFIVDARAGGFPRYYSPDAFLFTPRWGMIPKENVGEDARAARTAKYTYLEYALRVRERYAEQERKAFYCAATRARERLYVSASGRPTQGKSTPEILAELSPT